ncbi:uncharacterized protein LOC107473722 [Arachis duranensis]|uniref:Uncharacterized protein LOC107473722 n=1 Tax=Arachis duranensis TaxID=130453 RepID=A0A6P4CC42_ARADU|nr:uncharacterized protein LOC107473722 [Arachis duranensis]
MEENMENHHEEEAHNHGGGGRANHAGEDRRVLGSYINPNPENCERVNEEAEGSQEQANYIGNSPKQNYDPYSKTYNPGWRNHPNFGWGNQQDQSQDQRRHNPNNNATHQQFTQRTYQHPHNNTSHPSTFNPNLPSFDDRLSKIETLLEGICKDIQDNKVFKEEVRANIKNQGETIKKLEFQVGYLSERIPKPTDSFPSDTEKNPRGEAKKVRWEDCKMVTTSDKETEDKQSTLSEQPEDTSIEKEEKDHLELEISQQELLRLYAPFPQLLNGAVGKRIYSRFLDLFAFLHVNIPFIKALQQMPAYIKYMKELLPRKSSLKGGQTIVMNKECSALIQPELPAKRKDPGSSHISCGIGETMFDRALCDLGASINLMPLFLVKRLQINEIMPTDVVIGLADKTQKQTIGVVENVLLKVGKYFLPTDFVILDMKETRALIDVEQGELILRIHDERLSFNVFHFSQEADQENKEPSKDHHEILKEETSTKAQPTHLETPLIDEQGKQQMPQLKEKLEEPKPPEACKDNSKISLEEEATKSKTTSQGTKKKVPRRWRNKKIPTEDFSPGDKVISAYSQIFLLISPLYHLSYLREKERSIEGD